LIHFWLAGLWLALAVFPSVCGAQLTLLPQQVNNGEAVLLRWQGETPSFGVVRFNERVFSMDPSADGAVVLLPVPLDLPGGDYPLLAAIADRRGQTTAVELVLTVTVGERPVEKLTLPERMVTPRRPEDLARIERDRRILADLFAVESERLWDEFVRPVDDPVSSIFGKHRLLNGKPRAPHSGTDFRSPRGTPVRTIAAGRTVMVAELFYTGRTVVVDHGAGLLSLYAHLSASDLLPGQILAAGETIGLVGSTGRSTGPHLHLTVRLHGERVDPLALIELMARVSDATAPGSEGS